MPIISNATISITISDSSILSKFPNKKLTSTNALYNNVMIIIHRYNINNLNYII